MKKQDFDKITPPRKPSRSPSAGKRKGAGKGKGKDGFKPWRLLDSGIKEPKYCVSFFNTGICKWEKDSPGKTCIIPHMRTQQQYDAKYKEFNP